MQIPGQEGLNMSKMRCIESPNLKWAHLTGEDLLPGAPFLYLNSLNGKPGRRPCCILSDKAAPAIKGARLPDLLGAAQRQNEDLPAWGSSVYL